MADMPTYFKKIDCKKCDDNGYRWTMGLKRKCECTASKPEVKEVIKEIIKYVEVEKEAPRRGRPKKEQ